MRANFKPTYYAFNGEHYTDKIECAFAYNVCTTNLDIVLRNIYNIYMQIHANNDYTAQDHKMKVYW